MNICACNTCGLEVKPGKKFIHGHNNRGSKKLVGRTLSESHRKNIGIGLLGNKSRTGQNKLEQWFELFLHTYVSIEWRFVGTGQLIIGNKSPDFWDGGKQLIELNGCYYHSCPEHHPNDGKNPDSSREKTAIFKAQGFQTIIVWEHELQETDKVIERIGKFI